MDNDKFDDENKPFIVCPGPTEAFDERAKEVAKQVKEVLKREKDGFFIADCFDHVTTLYTSAKKKTLQIEPVMLTNEEGLSLSALQAINKFIQPPNVKPHNPDPDQPFKAVKLHDPDKKEFQCFELAIKTD